MKKCKKHTTFDENLKENIVKAYNSKYQGTEGTLYNKNTRTIQGLEDYNVEDLKSGLKNDIENILEENGIDANIVDLDLHGSRLRGTANNNSDLDVVVQYDGDIREDDLFNLLNEKPIEIDGVKVDINPIQENLQDYMKRSDEYDNQILAKNQNSEYNNIEKKRNIIKSKGITNQEKGQVNSEVMTHRQNIPDGIGYVDLSKYGYESYIYNKQAKDIQTLLKVQGTEEFKNYIRKGIENGTFTNTEGFTKSIAEIKSEYRRYRTNNDSLSGRESNNRNDKLPIRQTRGKESSNSTGNIRENSTNESIESQEGSFNLLENINYSSNKNLISEIFKEYNTDKKILRSFRNNDSNTIDNKFLEYSKRIDKLKEKYNYIVDYTKTL